MYSVDHHSQFPAQTQEGAGPEEDSNIRRPSAADKLPQLLNDEEVLFELVEAGDLDGVSELLEVRFNINMNTSLACSVNLFT